MNNSVSVLTYMAWRIMKNRVSHVCFNTEKCNHWGRRLSVSYCFYQRALHQRHSTYHLSWI